MAKRVILIHGWEGYPEEGWRPWLKKELEQRGFNVVNPAMPEASSPTMEEWVPFLSKIVEVPEEQTYLIGHSLGCITILRYLEELKESQMIGGAILVAGFGHDLEYEGYRGELSSFFKNEPNWKEIKSHCRKFVAIHSTNDPWVPVEHNKLFQDKLEAKSIIQENMKHFSGDDGITKLDVVLDELLRISS